MNVTIKNMITVRLSMWTANGITSAGPETWPTTGRASALPPITQS